VKNTGYGTAHMSSQAWPRLLVVVCKRQVFGTSSQEGTFGVEVEVDLVDEWVSRDSLIRNAG
jgi:hypothetical protein